VISAPGIFELATEVNGLRGDADKVLSLLGGITAELRDIAVLVTPTDPEYDNSASLQLENSRIVKSGAGRLFGFSGTNTKASSQFIQAFDTGTVPSNGAIPKFVMTAQASSDFWVSWTPGWRQFREGIVLCNSSTVATLTIGSADCWFDAQYT